MPGNIIFRPIEANLTRGTDMIFKMNPYCLFSLGDEKFTSEVCKRGGKHPQWDTSISIPASKASVAKLELMDKELFTQDDIIGSCQLNLKDIAAEGSGSRHWYPLFFEDKPAGEILLETAFEEDFDRQNWSMGSESLESGLKQGSEKESRSLNGDLSSDLKRTDFSEEMEPKSLKSGLKQGSEKESKFVSSNLSSDLKKTDFSEEMEFKSAHSDLKSAAYLDDKRIIDSQNMFIETGSAKFFTEQHQTLESRTFIKDVEATEMISVEKNIEVMEERKILRDVEYTEAVPVTKEIEVVEPVVVWKEIEVIEPTIVTKTIKVIENRPVKKMIEVVEMKHTTQKVETMEPQTFHKQIEVTEQFPVTKTVTINEPMTTTKSVEFVQPIVITQTITKEIRPEIIVNQTFSTETLPASLAGVIEERYLTELRTEIIEERTSEEKFSCDMTSEQRLLADKSLEEKLLGEEVGEQEFFNEESRKEELSGEKKKSHRSRKHKKNSSDLKEDLGEKCL